MQHLAAAIVLITAAAAAFFDARTGRIPDALTLGALGFGLGMSCVFGLLTIVCSIAGVAAMLIIGAYVEQRTFRLGGGDFKFMMAVGAILGIVGLAFIAVSVSILLEMLPPKISRPMAPIVFGVVVYYVMLKEVLGC